VDNDFSLLREEIEFTRKKNKDSIFSTHCINLQGTQFISKAHQMFGIRQ